ncbi:unnamed protein product [Withania somnifera]
MSAPNEYNVSQQQFSAHVFYELLDSIIVDVASECHRIAKLGLDRNLEEENEEFRSSAQARASVADPSNSSETNGKYIVVIFGHFVGGRKAHLKAKRSSTAPKRYTRGSSASTYSPYSNPTSTSRTPNGCSGVSGHEYSN